MVELILNLVGYTPDRDLGRLVCLEPACGTGEFLVPLAERLSASLRQNGRPLVDARGAIKAYDLLEANVRAARQAVTAALVADGWDLAEATDLAEKWIVQADFLLSDRDEGNCDFVIGNPPYIRLEDVPQTRSQAYRKSCPTMGGRADIFVGFYEKGLRALRESGQLGFICADRWMRNSYGKQLRKLVADHYSVDVTIVMHDVDAFYSQVSAYPAITILRAGAQGPVLLADTTREFGEHAAEELVKWWQAGQLDPLHRLGLTAAWLPHWFTGGDGWPTGSPERLSLVARLEERLPLLEDTGAKVGIGLATGADDVYVTTDVGVAEPERLLPMVKREDLKSGEVVHGGHHLVNPWTPEGLVELDDWPRLKSYFRKHDSALRARSIARRSPGREHRTIDRVIEGLTQRPKLLLADMSERIWPVLERGTYYPHHNLYWIHEGQSDWDLEVLGGLLLSDLAELFVSTYCVRMRGRTLRFQAQYLRRIRVPHYSDISLKDRAALAEAFLARDTAAATSVALRLYGVEAIPE